MKLSLRLLGAAGVGAGLMYLFDPSRGKRRRALITDKLTHVGKMAIDLTGRTGRDLSNHLLGAVAEMKSVFDTTEVSDDVLQERVRSKLGRVVSKPSAIKVRAANGKIVLSGPLPAKEEHPLLNAVFNIGGVKTIENLLELHGQNGQVVGH